jgi:hypothetical protein
MIATRHLTLVIAALAAAACDQLRVDPGGDFGVKVLSPTPLAAIGQASVALDFAVSGCDAFQVAVEAGVTSHAIDAAKKADGNFSAAVPVDWLREEDGTCLDDARNPHASAARLVVTCADAGRNASVDLPVSYGTASVAYQAETAIRLPQGTVQQLFPSADPSVPYALTISPLEAAVDLNPVLAGLFLSQDGIEELDNPLARPRVAANGTSVFLSSGCFNPSTCPQVAVSSGTTLPGELLQGTTLRDGAGGGTLWQAWVPSSVLDLAFMPDGALLVLSQANDSVDPFVSGGVAVTRVVPAQPAGGLEAAEVTVIGYFPGESARTRFSRAADGRLAFISFALPPGGGRLFSVMHLTGGATVENLSGPTADLDLGTGGSISVSGGGLISINGGAQLSPDATALVAAGAQLGPPGGPFSLLPSADPASYPNDDDTGGAAWPAGAVALWRGMSFTWRIGADEDLGRVESFDLLPPHARRFLYDVHALPGGPQTAQLEGVTAVGDKLVLTTSSGVRVLGPDGALVGGADPLPCGLSPTALAIPTGPSTFAVAAGNFVYVFDLAASP